MPSFDARWALLLGVFLAGCLKLGFTGQARAPASTGVVVVEDGATGSTPQTPQAPPSNGPVTVAPTTPPVVESAPPVASSTSSMPSCSPTLAVGESHTCSLSASGQVRCWGYNMQGQLGVGSTRHPAEGIVNRIGDASDGPVRAIAAGGYQTCALTSAGRVWCWGQNHEGQVGNGEVTEAPVRTPALVRGIDHVERLVLGDTVSCALTTAGALYCWGENAHGEIDDSGRRQLTSPTRVAGVDRPDQVVVGNYHMCALKGGRVTCRGTLAALSREISALDEISAVSAGWEHGCVLRRGIPLCFGRSYLGVLGRGRFCPEGTSATCDADVWYPPTAVPGVTGAVAIDGHDYHTCSVLESGGVTCWGNNQGHAFADDLPAEPWQTAHPVAALQRVDAVCVGGTHNCALRGGQPLCAGNDSYGQVGGARAR